MASIFTQIMNGALPSYKIWEDKNHIAFLDIRPLHPGHTLVVPKKEMDHWQDIEQEIFCELMAASQKVAQILKKATGAKRIGLSVEGFGVPHLHVHLIPINAAMEMDPNLAHDAPPAELKKMQQEILNAQ